jgi:type IV secretory pathway TrbD component
MGIDRRRGGVPDSLMSPDDTVVEEPIFAALWRPRLFLGCNIVPLASVSILAVLLLPVSLMTGPNLWWFGVAIAIMVIAIPVLQCAARKDPYLWTVFWRYVRYDHHYAAVGRVLTKLPPSRRHQR